MQYLQLQTRQTKFDRITQRSEGSEVRALVSQARPGAGARVRTEDSSGPGSGSGMVNLMHDRRVVRCGAVSTLSTHWSPWRVFAEATHTASKPGGHQASSRTQPLHGNMRSWLLLCLHYLHYRIVWMTCLSAF